MEKYFEHKIRALEKWFFEKKNIISLFFKNPDKNIHVSLGEIYWAKLGVNIGREIDKMRPVLIFQGNDWIINNSDMVFVIPITSNNKKGKFSVPFLLSDTHDGNVSGNFLLQQSKSISKWRLGRKITKLKKEKLYTIRDKFDILLYKNTPLSSKRKGDGSFEKKS